jgi:hypothetical protein
MVSEEKKIEWEKKYGRIANMEIDVKYQYCKIYCESSALNKAAKIFYICLKQDKEGNLCEEMRKAPSRAKSHSQSSHWDSRKHFTKVAKAG